MEQKALYSSKNDLQFTKPYIDTEEKREEGYLYVHGGFEGTYLKFAFFYPEKKDYKGRFFQYLSPVQGDENAAIGRKGMEDRIRFANSHGAYYVESNMGAAPFAPLQDSTIIYRASAAAAEFSREVAKRLYGNHRPYGYVYGGSGGSFKTISCLENTDAWDGAAPYVTGTPYSIPYSMTIRTHAKRVLRNVFPLIADYIEPGGITKEDLYAKLTDEEKSVLEESISFGFPLRSWCMREYLDDGSLPIFVPMVLSSAPEYFRDFWEKEGYLGYDKNGSARRDRLQMSARVQEIFVPGVSSADTSSLTGVDDAWLRNKVQLDGIAWVRIDKQIADGTYIDGTHVTVNRGKAAGYKMVLKEAHGNYIFVEPFFGATDFIEKFSLIEKGEELSIDNSDYIALQSLHRHQTPDGSFWAWNVYRNEDGTPKYPQQGEAFGPRFARGGCGSLQSGDFGDRKMIAVCALMDESALPWQGDWYRRKVRESRGDDKPHYRLWYVDHAFHGDCERTPDDLHLVQYLGVLHSALLAVSDWVEKGIEPQESTAYSVYGGEVIVPESATERKGVQPTVLLTVNGGKCARVKAGEVANFAAQIQLPAACSKVTDVQWSFDGKKDFDANGEFVQNGQTATAKTTHAYTQPGTYFAVVRAVSQLHKESGNDEFTRIYNIDRVRVVVE